MSKARAPIGRLRNARESSPRADEFHTGYSEFITGDFLHSTQNLNCTDHEQFATRWSRGTELDDEGSASMSIELGRGTKRAGDELDDLSSNAAFPIGEDSGYEITKTPPLNSMTRKNDKDMRREVSIRRANEGAKRSISQPTKAPVNLSDALRTHKMMIENTTESIEVVVNTKNTRFTHKRIIPAAVPSGQNTTPAPLPRKIPQSAADTGDFALPDVSNIGELIDPVQKDGTFRTLPSKNRSRFTPSTTHRMPVRFEGVDRVPVRSVPIPEDEKKIYAALQTLQEKFNQLELDNAQAAEHLNLYERENIELRNALAREEELRRPDSALGSEDETAKEKWRLDRTKLQSSLRSVQQRFDKVEYKLKLRESDLRACMKERDELITQLGVECYRSQEVETENAQLRQDHGSLRMEVDGLRRELICLRSTAGQPIFKDITGTFGHQQTAQRASDFATTIPKTTGDTTAARSNGLNFDLFDQQARQHIADAVKQQWQSQQDRQRTTVRSTARATQSTMFDIENRSTQALRPSILPARRQHIPTVGDADGDEEVFTEFELTNTKNLTQANDIDDDITELTPNDPLQVRNLRQMLEEQRRALHLKRQSSAPDNPQQASVPQTNRRSSLRDLTGTVSAEEVQGSKRTVRVQSPPVDEDTQTSLPSNVGRRRNSAAREDGETSAFLIPDITLHRKAALRALDTKGRNHDVPSCTMCNKTDVEQMPVPALVAVSSRADLPEDSTIRPSQPPLNALARVAKQLNDELAHVKHVLAGYQKQHNSNDPTVGARARKELYDKISKLMAECKRKEDQVYALYDAAEGQVGLQDDKAGNIKQRVATPAAKRTTNALNRDKPVSALGLDGAHDIDSDEESVGLPAWEGLSESEE